MWQALYAGRYASVLYHLNAPPRKRSWCHHNPSVVCMVNTDQVHQRDSDADQASLVLADQQFAEAIIVSTHDDTVFDVDAVVAGIRGKGRCVVAA